MLIKLLILMNNIMQNIPTDIYAVDHHMCSHILAATAPLSA